MGFKASGSKYDEKSKNKIMKYFPSDFFNDSLDQPYTSATSIKKSKKAKLMFGLHKNSTNSNDFSTKGNILVLELCNLVTAYP